MAAIQGQSTKSITSYQLDVQNLVREMQKLKEAGASNEQIYSQLGAEFDTLRTRGTKLEKMMRLYAKNTKDSQKATANLKTRIKALNTEVKSLDAAENKLAATAKKNIREAAALAKQIRKGSESSKKAAKDTKTLGDAQEKQGKQAKKSGKDNKDLGKSAKSTNKGLKGALGTLIKFGAAGAILGGILKALKFVFIDSFKAAVQFEKGLANLAAVGGVSGGELDNLKEAALDTAGATKFTANEILGLQTELSKLGFTSDEVVNSTKAIALGAQALGTGLSETATSVGKLINQFGLMAQDSDVIVDTLVTTINESALSLDTFSTAIQYVGPISRDLGVNLQETSAAMAVLADNGFTASRIGTGLRGIFTELGSETVDVKAKLKDLADENLSLSEAVDLVGKRNAAQLITLLNNVEVLEESEDVYYQQGRALEAAAEQATTFSGQMDLVRSAVNEAQINFGDFILSTGVFQKALSLISTTANETYLAFDLLKNQGAKALTEDLESVVEQGLDPFDVALARVAKEAGKTTEEIKKAFDKNNLPNDVFFEELVDGLFFDEKSAEQMQGYFDLLNEELAKVQESNIIKEQRQDVDDLYLSTLNEMIQAERDGVDVSKQANELAGKLNGDRQALIRGAKDLREELETNENLTETEIRQKKDLILLFTAQEKALANYERRFANFVLAEDLSEKISRRKARTFKEELDIMEDLKDAQDKNAEVQVLASEASGNYIDSIEKRIMGNEDLISTNNDVIQMAATEKKSIQDKIAIEKQSVDSKGVLTKQAQENIKTYEKEIATLDTITAKYEEKNEALDNSTGTLKDSTKALEKELKALEKEYEKGDIGTQAFERQRQEVIDNYTKLLKEIAEKNPELKAAIDALLKSAGDVDNPIDWRNILSDGIDEAIDVVTKSLEGFSKTTLENTKNRLEAEKDALKARYETEDFLAKQQFENGLINESQFRRRQAQLRKKQIAEENAIDKKIFEAEQKGDKDKAKTDYLEALASIIPELIKAGKVIPTDLAVSSAISAALATAAFGAEMSAIGQRKFFPKKFAEGGMVEGPSHSQGGVPFSVQGQGGFEMEGGEFIINKRAASIHRDLLEKINGSIKPNLPTQPMKFAQGGLVSTSQTRIVQSDSTESVNYLKAIAEATTTNAINSSRPVRAFVSSKDLRQDESARRIKDNNTTI
jgi:hypothetical protein